MQHPPQTLGPHASLQTRLLWATHGTPGRPRMPLHFRPGIAVWHLHRGRVELSFGSEHHSFTGPCWLLLGTGRSSHSFSDDSILTSVSVRVRSSVGPFLSLPHATELDLSPLDPHARALIAIYGQRSEPCSPLQTAIHQLKLHAAVASWTLHLGQLLEHLMPEAFIPATQHTGLRNAVAWLEEHPHDATECDLARAAGLSVSHFKRVFNREMGIPLREFRRRRQVDDTIEALLHTDKPIKQIAHELGYSDTANFDRWFRQHFNRPPSAYRTLQSAKPAR